MAAKSTACSVFGTEHLRADLKGRSVRGGAATVAGQAVQFVIHTASAVVLARLLTPADFGLVAMVTAVTGFATLFKDLGLSMATVQKAEITHGQISALFWINVGMGFLVALATAALAPAIAWFYGDPRLASITVALSFTFILGGLAVQHQALLQRKMRFTVLAVLPALSMTAGMTAAIVGAKLGADYWALVAMQLAGALTNAVAVWIACRWWPGWPVRRAGIRSMLGFGAHLTGFNVINYFARNLDHILLGRVWGAGSLGLYSRAYGLLMLPIRQITAPLTAVAIPALSRLQGDPGEYSRYYFRATNVIALVTMPMILVLAALSKEVIVIVLGEQWTGAAGIFKVLAFAALIQSVTSTTGWVFISFGQTDRQLHWAVASVPLITLSFIVGLPWGALGVAVSYTICIWVLTFPCLWWAFRHSPLGIGRWLRAVHRPFVTGLAIYFGIELLRHQVVFKSPVAAIIWSSIVAVVIFGVILVFWRGMRDEVFLNVQLLRALGPTDSRPGAVSPAQA